MRKPMSVRPTLLDRAIIWAAPVRGARRLAGRALAAQMEAVSSSRRGGHWAARRDRRSLADTPGITASGDSALLPDLPTLQARALELETNMPLARGALRTLATHVIGAGLRPLPQIDRQALGLTEAEAEAKEAQALVLWRHFAKRADLREVLDMGALEYQAFHSVLSMGDCFALLTDELRPGDLFGLKVQLIEAPRVCNPDLKADTPELAGGIKRDSRGRPISAFVANKAPFDFGASSPRTMVWQEVRFRGATSGRRNLLHLLPPGRIGESRGVPLLAPVIEDLKQLSDYTKAELMAAVVNSCFAIVNKTEGGSGLPLTGEQTAPDGLKRTDLTFEPAMVIEGLMPNESVESFTPGRPNPAFEAFFTAVVRQIAVALDLSFEVLVRHFTASYSASKAALEETFRFVIRWRTWFTSAFCQPVWEELLAEAVVLDLIDMPGFLELPLAREAWLGCTWIGPGKGWLNPAQEVAAAKDLVAGGFSTEAAQTALLTGGDWEADQRQRAKERRRHRADGTDIEATAERIRTEPTQPEPAEPPTDDSDLETPTPTRAA